MDAIEEFKGAMPARELAEEEAPLTEPLFAPAKVDAAAFSAAPPYEPPPAATSGEELISDLTADERHLTLLDETAERFLF